MLSDGSDRLDLSIGNLSQISYHFSLRLAITSLTICECFGRLITIGPPAAAAPQNICHPNLIHGQPHSLSIGLYPNQIGTYLTVIKLACLSVP